MLLEPLISLAPSISGRILQLGVARVAQRPLDEKLQARLRVERKTHGVADGDSTAAMRLARVLIARGAPVALMRMTLSMSRAFGDLPLKDVGVIVTPDGRTGSSTRLR